MQDRARRWLRQQLKAQAEAAVHLCEEYGSAGLLRQTLYLLQSGEAHFTAVNNLADYESAQKDLQQLAEDTAAYFTDALVGDCAAGNKKALSGCLDAIRAALANLDDEANIALLSDVIGRLRKSGKNAETIGLLKERLGQIVQYPACVRSAELIPYWESYLAALQQHLAAAKKKPAFWLLMIWSRWRWTCYATIHRYWRSIAANIAISWWTSFRIPIRVSGN